MRTRWFAFVCFSNAPAMHTGGSVLGRRLAAVCGEPRAMQATSEAAAPTDGPLRVVVAAVECLLAAPGP